MKPRLALLLVALAAQSGCNQFAMRSQNPDDLLETQAQVRLVGDAAVPYGMNYLKIESPALVTNLSGTGSDPPPSSVRSAVLGDMQQRKVDRPNQILGSPATSVVIARAYVPPGAQKGDPLDIDLRLPAGSETTSLAGGWLMQCRLREIAVVGGEMHDGHLQGLAQGPVLTDADGGGEKPSPRLRRGSVLGGGVVTRPRPMGLVLRPESQNALLSKKLGEAINRRFFTTSRGVQIGVAKPKTDKFIELIVHPRYKENIGRYVRVVRSIPVRERANERVARLELLQRQLLDPLTAKDAALRLEAIGKEAVRVLTKGARNSDPEVRFYSAEALAYLDEATAVGPLAAAARDEPAFRADALAALGALNDSAAYDALVELLHVRSAETRYGAFCALRSMNARDPLVRGENMRNHFMLHALATRGPAMIHLAGTRRPEIVLFGRDLRLQTPLALMAGSQIMLNSNRGDEITVSRFAVGQPDQNRVVSNRLDDVLRAVVELGGTYPDVVWALQQAKARGMLTSRVVIDALPRRDRKYERPEEATGALADDSSGGEAREERVFSTFLQFNR